jgi:glycosyltransferase involved in cell wall biosynthesis
LLFLGRINFKKGLDLLVPAFALVALKYPGARLAVVGPDNEGFVSKVRRWCVEKGIKDKVFFMDYLGFEKVKEAYVDADVFILPSYTENFGMTVVAAMACGCPVIISDQVNIWREVQETGAGVVARLNPHALAKSLCRVLDDIGAAQDIGARGRAVAEKRFAWPPIVDQMTQVYRGLIEKKTTGDWQQSRCS